MPYITRDESENIKTMSYVEQFYENKINVLSATCENKLVTINLETACPLDEACITTAIISEVNEHLYNGKFPVTRISDTQFTYILLKDAPETATGNIKVQFALEYIADDHQDILDLQIKYADFDTISNRKRELAESDYKIIRHNEEVAAGIAEENRTLTQTEFNTLHTERNTLRSEIKALEEKYDL